MKKQANAIFQAYVKEDSDYPTTYGLPKVGPADFVPSADDQNKSAHQVTSDPEMLQRVNAWLGALTERPYMNPYSAITYLRQKMAITGLDFKEPKLSGEYGRESVPCTQWGNPTSLTLQFTWVCVKGWYTISAELEGEVQSSQPITEGSNTFSLVNNRTKWRQNRVQKMFKRYESGSRVASMAMRRALSGMQTKVKKTGHAIKAAFGSGGYTATQGRKGVPHQKAPRSKSFLSPGSVSKLKKMTEEEEIVEAVAIPCPKCKSTDTNPLSWSKREQYGTHWDLPGNEGQQTFGEVPQHAKNSERGVHVCNSCKTRFKPA